MRKFSAAAVCLVCRCVAPFVEGIDDRDGVRGVITFPATLTRDDSSNDVAAAALVLAEIYCGDAGVPLFSARETRPMGYGIAYQRMARFVCGAGPETIERGAVINAADPAGKCGRVEPRKLHSGAWVVDVCGELFDCVLAADRWNCRAVPSR